MKKIISVLAAMLACLFLFAACSAQVVLSLNPNWTDNGSVPAPTDFHETLTYGVSFEKDDLGTLSLNVAEGSSYVMETTVKPSYRAPDGNRYAVYELTTTLTLRGSFTDNDGNVLHEFGTTGDDANDRPDEIKTTVWFHSLDGGRNLRPIRSETKGYYHALDSTSGYTLSVTKFKATIEYNNSATSATVQLENLWTEEELSGDNAKINDYTVRSSLPRTQSFSVGDLQKNYSGFDAGQLYFVGRGISFSENGSNTVTLASIYGKLQCALTCGEFADLSCNFTVNGGEPVTTVNTAPVTFTNSGNGQNRGPSRTVNYARATDASSGYYNVPVRISETFAYDVGNLVFTLQSIAR